MNKSEVVLLLTFAATYDHRKTGEADVEAWYLALDDLPFDDAKAAIVAHYREQTDRIMPAHVRKGVRAIRDERRRLKPSEALQLPSRFEDDEDRTDRARRGSAQVQTVLAELAQRMQDRSENIPDQAMKELREITDGPAWAEVEGSNR